MRAQGNLAPQILHHLPVNASAPAPHAPMPLSRRQATLPPTPTSSLAEHRNRDDSSDSSMTSVSEAPPNATISKLAPKHHPRTAPVATSQDEKTPILSRSTKEQPTVQSRVAKGPAEAPSRSSSVSLESLLAEHEGSGDLEPIITEVLQLSASPWIDSPSPIVQRPEEKRKSSQVKEGDHEKWAAGGSNGPPKKRPRVETEQVTDDGGPEDQSKGTASLTPAGAKRPPLSNILSKPNTRRPYNGTYLGQPELVLS
jgi:hypothetical protein